MRRISVGDVMTRNFVFAEPNSTLHDCSKKMIKGEVDSLLIAKGERLIGILTARDILRRVTDKPHVDLRKVNCLEVAKRKIAVIKPSADITQAINKMMECNFRRLPVVSKGKLIGVVTMKDILAIEPTLYAEMKGIMDEVREEERKVAESGAPWPLEGLCENCGAFSDLLKVEGRLLCLDCREEIY